MSVGEARELGNLAHDARRAHALKVATKGLMRIRKLRLGHNIEVATLREKQIKFTEQLDSRCKLAPRLARALRNRAPLRAVMLEKGEDKIALPQLGPVDNNGGGVPGPTS